MYNKTEQLYLSILTVGAAIEFQTYSGTTLLAPLQWDEANVACQDGVLELMANHALTVYIPFKCLKCIQKSDRPPLSCE